MRRLVIAAVVLCALAMVANGPGFRLVATKVLNGKLAAAGLRGDFKLAGTAFGGIALSDLALVGSRAVTKLEIDAARISYDLMGLLRKRGIAAIGPIEARGIDAEFISLPDRPKKPFRQLLHEVGDAWGTVGELATLDVTVSDVDIRIRREDGAESFLMTGFGLELKEGAGAVGIERMQIAGSDPIGELRGQLRVLDGLEIELAGIEIDEGLSIKRLAVGPPVGSSGFPRAQGELVLFGGAVSLRSEGEERLLVQLESGAINLDQIGERFGKPLPVSGSVGQLDVVVEGRFEDAGSISVRGELAAAGLSGFGLEAVEADASLRFANDVLNFEKLSVGVSGNAVTGKGKISLVERAPGTLPDMRFDLDLDVPRIGDMAHGYEIPLEGAVLGKIGFGIAAGKLDAISGDLRSPALSYGDALVNDVHLAATPNGSASDFTCSLKPGVDGNSVVGGGRFDFPSQEYAATATAEFGDLAELGDIFEELGIGTALAGTGKVVWKGDGSLRTAEHRGEAEIDGLSLSLADAQPVSGSLIASYSPAEFSASKLDLSAGEIAVRGAVRLANSRLELDAIRVRSTKVEGLELARLDAAMPFESGALRSADAFFEQSGQVRLKLESAGLQIGDLLALAQQEVTFTGGIDADLLLGGTLSTLAGDGSIKVRQIKLVEEGGFKPADADLGFKVGDGQLTLAGEVRQEGLPPITLNGRAPLRPRKIASNPEEIARQSFDLRAKFPQSELALLRQFVPSLIVAEGSFSGELHLSGTAAQPKLAGRVVAKASRLKFRGDGLPSVTDVALDVSFKDDRATVQTGRVMLAGGKLELGGDARLTPLSDPQLALTLAAREALLYRDESMSLRANGDFKLAGPLSAAHLSGRIGIVHSQFVREIEILPIGLPRLRRAPSAPRAPALDTRKHYGIAMKPFADWTLDVKLSTDEAFQVRSNLARATILADLHVTGTGERPVPVGKVWLGDGSTATLPFSELKVREGILEFDAKTGFDPRVRFLGVSEVRGNEITLRVYDQISNPQTLITSDPPLPEEDAVTLLATGRRASELGDQEVIASTAASLLFDKVRRKVFKQSPGDSRNPFGDNVDFKAGGLDPKTGNRSASATVKVSERVYLLGGIDTGGDYRGLAKFLVRVK